MSDNDQTKDRNYDAKDFYQALVSFQAKALHYVAESAKEDDRKNRIKSVVDKIHEINSLGSSIKEPPSSDVKNFYQVLVSFQAKALLYVGEIPGDGDPKPRIKSVVDKIHEINEQWFYIKTISASAEIAANPEAAANYDRCPNGLIWCNGDCVPPSLC